MGGWVLKHFRTYYVPTPHPHPPPPAVVIFLFPVPMLNTPIPSLPDHDSKPTVTELMNMGIINKVSSKWMDIGLRFGLSMNELDGFRTREMLDNTGCCVRVFDSWINNGGTAAYPVTWRSIYNVLCDIGNRGAANEMKTDLAKAGIII